MVRHTSLKWRLVISIGVLAIFSALMLSQMASQLSRSQIESDQDHLLQNIAVRMAAQLSQDMSTRANEILFMTNLERIRDPNIPVEKKRAILELMRHSYPYYAWIGIADKTGNIIVGTNGLLEGKNVAKRDWFLEGSEGLHFGNPHDAFLLAKKLPKPKWDDLPLRLVDVSAPIKDDQGRLVGVICGHLSLDWAYEARDSMLDRLSSEHIDLVVLNQEGKVMLGTPQIPSMKVDLSSLKAFQELATANRSVVNETWSNGRRYLTAAVRQLGFRNFPGMGWVIIARKDESSAFAAAENISGWILFGGLSVALAFTVLLWLMLRHALHPLEEISRVARKIQGNDLSEPIPVPLGNDEVAVFARSLTGLVGTLQARNADFKLADRVFEESGQGILITDKDRRILRVNRAFTRITGYTAQDVKGQFPSLLKSGMTNDSLYQVMWASIAATGKWQGEIWNRTKSGHIYPEWLTINTLTDDNGGVSHYIGIFDDISEKKEYERRLVHMANYDQLTELPNRNLLQSQVQEMLNAARLKKLGVALMFIDLDKFKNINDTLGHVIGDQVLKEVANRFRAHIGAQDLLSRWGGDEFVVALMDSDSAAASAQAQRLVETLQRPFIIEGTPYHLGMSIGIALYPVDCETVDSLLRCADTAMYQAKRIGANLYRFYESDMNAGVEQFLKIDNALRQAMDEGGDGLSLALQPQFTADGQRIVSAEALIRWNHPGLGQIPPSQFIPIAEDTGQIIRLGEWIIEEVSRIYAELKRAGCGVIPISFNCSARQLRDSRLIDTLRTVTERHGVPPEHLMIEVTESAIMSDEFKSLETLSKLRSLGYRLSLDDFGTGYSSLNYIQKIHPAEIKVDKGFVQDMLRNPDSRNIIAFTVSLATSMNMDVVAEGVETEAQRLALRDMGSIKLQGFLLGKPMPLSEFIVKLRSNCP